MFAGPHIHTYYDFGRVECIHPLQLVSGLPRHAYPCILPNLIASDRIPHPIWHSCDLVVLPCLPVAAWADRVTDGYINGCYGVA